MKKKKKTKTTIYGGMAQYRKLMRELYSKVNAKRVCRNN